MQPARAAGGPKRCLAGMDLAGGIELPLSCVPRSASAAVRAAGCEPQERVVCMEYDDCVLPLEAKPEIAGQCKEALDCSVLALGLSLFNLCLCLGWD